MSSPTSEPELQRAVDRRHRPYAGSPGSDSPRRPLTERRSPIPRATHGPVRRPVVVAADRPGSILLLDHVVAADHAREQPPADCPAPRVNGDHDMVTSAHGTPWVARSSSSAGPGPPRKRARDLFDDLRDEAPDDPSGDRSDRRVLDDEPAPRPLERIADELGGEIVAPGPAIRLDEVVFRADPVGLGVDEGAVHVP